VTDKKIRIRVAGFFVENDRLLLVKHRKENREYYLLPGGGQDYRESQHQCLEREFKEELDVKPNVGKFLFCGESIPPSGSEKNHIFQVVLRVTGLDGILKLIPDPPLYGFDFIPTGEIENITLFPNSSSQIRAVLANQKCESYVQYKWVS